MEASHVFSTDALAGEVALVTGASRGIGAATAAALARAGAHVVGTATTEAGAAAISHRLAEGGAGGRGAVLDVTDAAGCEALVDGIVASQGKLSILVNNAGITRDQLMIRMKREDWDAVIATNLTAAYACAQAVLKPMLKQRTGRIVNITSVVGQSGNAGQANYAASKAGVIGLTKALALEVASRNITVNAVAPGLIATDMTKAMSSEVHDDWAARIPLRRLGTAEDVASAVVFLASDEAAYITGHVLAVNGGMYM
jgi:3-oxoacyl-[acyl-carrier protein] reductase